MSSILDVLKRKGSHGNNIAEAVENLPEGGGELTPATVDTLGGVKIGEGVNVTEDGTISVSGGGELVPCNYTFAIQDIISPTIYRNISNLNKGRGYIGQVLTLYIPGINRVLGNNDEHESGDTWYTVVGIHGDQLGQTPPFVQVLLTEDGQEIMFDGTLNTQA